MAEDFLDRFLNEYYAESEEHLAAIRRSLLTLEESVGQPRPAAVVTEELFRSFHSIKGISAMVEHREAEHLAHEMESYLRAVREGQTRLTTEGVEALIEGTRLLDQSLVAHRGAQPQPETAPALAALRRLVSAPTVSASNDEAAASGGVERPVMACLFTPSPSLVARGITVDVVRSRLREHGEILRAQPSSATTGRLPLNSC